MLILFYYYYKKESGKKDIKTKKKTAWKKFLEKF